jgi:hypothetical protein
MKWTKDVSAEFVKFLEKEGVKFVRADVISEDNTLSINLLHERDEAAKHFVARRDGGLGYDAPPAPAEPPAPEPEKPVDPSLAAGVTTPPPDGTALKPEPTPEPTPESATPAAVTPPTTTEA